MATTSPGHGVAVADGLPGSPLHPGGLTQVGTGDHNSPLLIWEYFRATERLLRATRSPIFFQSLPCREWYIFNFLVSPLLYLRERKPVTIAFRF